MNYYADMKDESLSEMLRQSNIKTKNQLIDLSDSSWQDFPYTGRSTEAYIVFYQGGKIDHGTHVLRIVAQSGA